MATQVATLLVQALGTAIFGVQITALSPSGNPSLNPGENLGTALEISSKFPLLIILGDGDAAMMECNGMYVSLRYTEMIVGEVILVEDIRLQYMIHR